MSEPNTIQPAFHERNVPIFCSSSNQYSLYSWCMLHSLISHSSPEWNYDLFVLEENISQDRKDQLLGLAEGRSNVSVRIINVARQLAGKELHLEGGIARATWYRILAPSIFSAYDKIIYLDLDIVVCDDIAKLWQEELGENWLAGCSDWALYGTSGRDADYYLHDIGVAELTQYVNGGVLIYNLHQMRQHGIEQKCLEVGVQKKFRLLDQDALNHTCRGHVKLLDGKWNIFPARGYETSLPPGIYERWMQTKKNAAILHYIGEKPWDNPRSDQAQLWWAHARCSPSYEVMLQNCTLNYAQDMADYARNRRLFFIYKLLSHLTFGALHLKLNDRKNALRYKINRVRRLSER